MLCHLPWSMKGPQGGELWRDYIIYVEKTSEAGLLNFYQFKLVVVQEESNYQEVRG
jgi:hypothetical protein